ncbi:MAG: saccharopine dehydrogenase NADP-binding domain-containing protein [Phycisphaerae bacterium]|nr:saccharopine dehydrogenase NADP-binding domain-containing protein [Phycisphaerae bacterium]
MKKVLVLGAGLVSRPLVRYLLAQPDFKVTVASRTVSKAEKLIDGHPDGTALTLLADETDKLEQLIREHDLAISLLPAPLHPVVAELCIKHKKHMVTTSYVSPKMTELDGPAKDAGVMVLNEIGVDPGIDHMSAMRVIHDVEKRGGQVVSFKSYCGGLPAPEANDNPWGYKFSWSPRAVCTAGKNAACFREGGRQVDIPGPELFTCVHPVSVEGIGELEAYPNRDSLGYIDIYGLEGIETMFRGTLRYLGWCKCLKKVVDLGMLAEVPVTYPTGMTFAQWTANLIKQSATNNLRKDVAEHIGLDPADNVLDRLEWLGLFSNDPLPITGKETTALDILAALMNEKMPYQPGERDMIALVHKFIARFPDGREEKISSTLIDFGRPDGDNSMARTVSLPAAVGAKLILTGEIKDTGVHMPVKPGIYNPVLDELATMDIRCVEKTEA